MAAEPSELEELDPSQGALCAVGSLKVSFWGSTGPAWCSVDETETVDLRMLQVRSVTPQLPWGKTEKY